MIVEKNNCEVPNYLGSDLIKKTLQNYFEDGSLQVKHINFEMGSAAGDNYCSLIYRIRVQFRWKNIADGVISFIVKSVPIDDINQALKVLNVCEKEKIMYTQVLPFVESLLNTRVGPKILGIQEEPIWTIFMEDLSSVGYTKADRQGGLDKAHAKVVMQKLGKYHAGTMVLAQKNPKICEYFQWGMHRQQLMNNKLIEAVFFDNIPHLDSLIEKWPGFGSIAEKIKRINKNIKQILLDQVRPDPNEIKVINHGDVWVNNSLFKYNEVNPDTIEDVAFVDFQMGFYTSPGIDINYFLYTSLQLDVLVNNRDELISDYYEAFSKTLKALQYTKIPTEDLIRKEILRKEFYGFISIQAVFPLIAMDKNESQDNTFEALQQDDIAAAKRQIMFASDRVQKTLKHVLKRMDDLKVFDIS